MITIKYVYIRFLDEIKEHEYKTFLNLKEGDYVAVQGKNENDIRVGKVSTLYGSGRLVEGFVIDRIDVESFNELQEKYETKVAIEKSMENWLPNVNKRYLYQRLAESDNIIKDYLTSLINIEEKLEELEKNIKDKRYGI